MQDDKLVAEKLGVNGAVILLIVLMYHLEELLIKILVVDFVVVELELYTQIRIGIHKENGLYVDNVKNHKLH